MRVNDDPTRSDRARHARPTVAPVDNGQLDDIVFIVEPAELRRLIIRHLRYPWDGEAQISVGENGIIFGSSSIIYRCCADTVNYEAIIVDCRLVVRFCAIIMLMV